MKKNKLMLVVIGVLLVSISFTGCSGQKEYERINRTQSVTIMNLNDEVNRLNEELEELMSSREQLEKTKLMLQDRLKEELQKGDLSVEMQDKGLVVTVLNKILFASGSTDLKDSSIATLTKVGQVLKTEVVDHIILIEGHTDTDPIVHSNFKSNWELSTTRATEVVHFFVDKIGISPKRIIAMGYGEFHPVAPNVTEQGKSLNRRVEIVISPKKIAHQVLVPVAKEQDVLR